MHAGAYIMRKFLLGTAMALATGSGAIAADLAPVLKAPAYSPAYNWTGWYIGLNAGGAWGRFNAATTTIFSPTGYFAQSSVPAIAAAGAQIP